jgi:ACS family hexuronate transporter-like MFS transporter
MLAYPTTTWIIEAFSWPVVFYFNAAIGFLWMAAWLWYTTDTPREHPKISDNERQYIEAHVLPHTVPQRPPSFWSIICTPSVVCLCLTYMLYAFVAWIFILWLPTYLVEGRGLSRMEMGQLGMLPTFGGFLGMISGGVISDWLLRRGFGTRVARARFPGVSIALAVPLLLLAVNASSTTTSIIFFTLFYFTFSLAVSGYWTLPRELAPQAVGAVGGVMNTTGNFAGLFGPTVAGFIIQETGNWIALFYVAAGVALISSLIFALLVRTEPIRLTGLDPLAEGRQAEAGAGLSH